jgi:hypothetical protein
MLKTKEAHVAKYKFPMACPGPCPKVMYPNPKHQMMNINKDPHHSCACFTRPDAAESVIKAAQNVPMVPAAMANLLCRHVGTLAMTLRVH